MTTTSRGLALLMVLTVLLLVSVCVVHAQQPSPPRVAPRSSNSIQLTPASRLYWAPGPVDATHPAATSYEITVDGNTPIDSGPCVQTPNSVDPTYPCDADIPPAAFNAGQHTLAVRAVAATGKSGWSPSPPLDVTGIAQVPIPGAPLPPSTGPVILHQPPPLQLAVSPSLTVTAHSPQGATVTYAPPVPAGGKSPYQVSCNPGSGSTFPVGITTVTCTVVDALSTMASNTFTVTVLFTAPPATSTPWVSIGSVPVANTTTKDALILSPSEWLISTRKNGVYHTVDSGATFTAVNLGLGAGQTSVDTGFFVHTNSGAILLSATCVVTNCPSKAGVFAYDAAKSSWAPTGLTLPVNGFLATPMTGELLALAYDPSGSWDIFRSTDDAKTWTNLSGKFTGGTATVLSCAPDGQCWVATTNDGVWASASTDYSKWHKVGGGPNGGTAFGYLATHTILGGPTDLRAYDPTSQTFKTIPASGWNVADVVQSTYTATSGALYLGTNHVVIGTYHSSDGVLYSPFHEGAWNSLANSGTGVRVYVLAPLGNNEVLAVLRDGRLYRATLP